MIKLNLSVLITKDLAQHANEKINYAKHMESKRATVSPSTKVYLNIFKRLSPGDLVLYGKLHVLNRTLKHEVHILIAVVHS